MDKEKQIDIPKSEMGMSGYSTFAWKLWEKGLCNMSEAERVDQIMREMGYRKASDVARKIFEEIEEVLNMQAKIACQTRETAREADEPVLSWIAMLDGIIYSLRVIEEHIAELKMKYIGKDTNVTTNTESEKDNDTH